MKYGITELSLVPGRAEASDKSEMVTQLLFGDTFSIIESTNKFIKIKLQYDNYECWICKKQCLAIEKEEFLKISNSPYHCTTDLVQAISYKNNVLPIVMGSSLPNYEEKTFSISDHQVIYNGNISTPNRIGTKDKIVEDALMYLNAPYLWGGRSPFGIDCSGFTQVVYKINNIVIPRDANKQAKLGVGYSFIEEAEAGDVAFFDNEEGKINHVGILIDKNRIIHSSGKVRIDTLDHQGIFNKETNSYSHKLRIVKNFF
tara:strand:- start:574 stop:1347 length:774 start_codon:yes stop_codon:yes gene_type:complete